MFKCSEIHLGALKLVMAQAAERQARFFKDYIEPVLERGDVSEVREMLAYLDAHGVCRWSGGEASVYAFVREVIREKYPDLNDRLMPPTPFWTG